MFALIFGKYVIMTVLTVYVCHIVRFSYTNTNGTKLEQATNEST